MTPMRLRPIGPRALLVEVDDAAAWHAELWRRRAEGEFSAVEIVPGARTVLLDGVDDPAALAGRLPGWAPAGGTVAHAGDVVEIDVVYDGADLPSVAEHWGTTPAGVGRRLADIEFRVAFCGFAPGFAYLAGLPPHLAVPRLASPRPRVPAGSVAIAGEYAGVYPTESPGGWRLVGRTDLPLFDVDRDPPATLRPGTRVRFKDAR